MTTSRRSATRRVVALLGVLVLAAVTAVAVGQPRAAPAGHVSLPWWLLVVLFGVAEACVVRVPLGRGRSLLLTLGATPLVMGMFLAPAGQVLTAAVMGAALVSAVRRRRPRRLLALPAAAGPVIAWVRTVLALGVFDALSAGADPLGARACLAALAAAAVSGVVDAVTRGPAGDTSAPAVGGAAPVGGAVAPPTALARVGPSAGVALLAGHVGLLPVVASERAAAAVPVAVVFALALFGHRAVTVALDRHASLSRLYELSQALAAAPASTDVVGSLLRQSADLLHAAYAEVMLHGLGPEPQVWVLRQDEVVAGGRLAVTGPYPAAAAFLAARGVREAVVVPLHIDDQVSGHLLVSGRAGVDRAFGGRDVKLLETVANHGSVALRNGRLIERLQFEARHDELTGLPNRLSFRRLLEEAAAALGGSRARPFAVMVLDFDGFKAVNDTLGHQAGDELLRALAGRFVAGLGDDAVVARLGGDEFAVLAPGCADAVAARVLAARLLKAFEAPVDVAGTRLRVGGSLGVALAPGHGTSASDLLRHADLAMYAAKSGAGGARIYSDDLSTASLDGVRLAVELRDAVESDGFDVVAQPIVDLETGTVHSVEVLARWHHPELGPIAPEEFFAAAERSNQTAALSMRILDRALRAARDWNLAGHPVRVGVNLAARWLGDPSLPEQVGAALARHGVPADLLSLELTETAVIAEPRRTAGTLARLRELGVHLSVDDFGTGYSSLTYLSRLPVDQMKIDKSFVERVAGSPRDRAVVRSIIDLGRNLGLDVVAEGVTAPGTSRVLREMGCRLAQGYLFAQPVPVADVPALVAEHGVVPRALPGPSTPLPRRPVQATVLPPAPDHPLTAAAHLLP